MTNTGPMDHLDDWEESLAARYPAGDSLPAPERNSAGASCLSGYQAPLRSHDEIAWLLCAFDYQLHYRVRW